MNSIFNIGKDLVDELRINCKPELLSEIFNLRTEEWKYSQMSVEVGTVDIFGDLHGFQYSSYDLISSAIEIVLDQVEVEVFTTALSLLLTLIEESDTTEMPLELSKQWEVIENNVNRH